MGGQGRGSVAPVGDVSMTEAVQSFLPVYKRRPKSAEAGHNCAGWLGTVGKALMGDSP